MVNLALVLAGAILLAYAFSTCFAIKKLAGHDIVGPACYSFVALVFFFFAGYIAYFLHLLALYPVHTANELLTSAIFFFGAIFVVIVLGVNKKLLIRVREKNVRLTLVNASLKETIGKLNDKTKEAEGSRKKYKEKSEELERTLEEYYTARVDAAEQVAKGTFGEISEEFREKLDKLKKERVSEEEY